MNSESTFFSRNKRFFVVYALAILYCVFSGFAILHMNGWGDATRKGGTPGCICHSFPETDSVHVWIEGPESVKVGTTNDYYILMTGGPAVNGGYDITCDLGVLNPGDGTSAHPLNAPDDVTHAYPQPFVNDTVRWLFQYQAPLSIGADTIYSAGNSVNGDNNPDIGDLWNFGKDFVVRVVLNLDVADESSPRGFKLEQNYPNPFNPSTEISFRLEHESNVDLSIYDVHGRVVTTLVNERRGAGVYSVRFDGQKFASGLYFCRLNAGKLTAMKKMLLVK